MVCVDSVKSVDTVLSVNPSVVTSVAHPVKNIARSNIHQDSTGEGH